MAKNERKRTMVYSNVNKKGKKRADLKSASSKNEVIDLDNEIVIGLASFPKPEGVDKNVNSQREDLSDNGNESGQTVDKLFKKIKNKLFKRKQKEEVKEDINDDYVIGIETNKIEEKSKKKPKKKVVKKIVLGQKNLKPPPLTKKEKIQVQKRRAIKRMSACLLLLILMIGAIVYFFLSPVCNVKAIEVINNNQIGSEQIINASEIALNENMFKFSKREVKNKIMTNPYIEKVTIKRNIFTKKVKIDVKERIASLMLDYGNSYVYINNQGYILEISSVKLNTPIIKGYVTPLEDIKPGKRLCNGDLERLEDVLRIMEAANSKQVDELITHIDISDRNEYVLTLESEDKTIHLGDNKNLSTKMLYVKEMLKREKGIEGEFFLNMDLNLKDPMFREKV